MPKLPCVQKQIAEKKEEILLLLQQYSFTHPIVIAKSQELDRLIYLFMHQNSSLSSYFTFSLQIPFFRRCCASLKQSPQNI
ncbi:Spo0E family sporulation regulatory protein-aspartic acid phosphatase [Bacillus mycoides]|uniref:Spo0E family sporulation regulatory protein-aspartic acid phosphatase n=1 Tax=Bacillus mycoides TaxID=1405 RepID=UPI003D065A48